MLLVDPRLLRNLDSLDSIRSALQVAIRLEHSTIPPYLTAAWSLTGNDAVVSLITDVAIEEMLHMTLVCNILNAIGGHPVLDDPTFVPKYPGPLPGTVHTSLSVGIESFSKSLLRDTFMVIEEPETPLDADAPQQQPTTIGAFYRKLKECLAELKPEDFSGKPELQVLQSFGDDDSIAVGDAATAATVIGTIIDQGEGSPQSILESDLPGEDELAHYYRFGAIVHEHMPVLIGGQASYTGAPVLVERRMKPNAKTSDYAAAPELEASSKAFNRAYTEMLKLLHQGFNGTSNKIDAAIGRMLALPDLAEELFKRQLNEQFTGGPTFEFIE
jgi:rubrerythrin